MMRAVRANRLRSISRGACLALVIAAGCGGERTSSASSTTTATTASVVSLTRIVEAFASVRSYGFASTTTELLPAPVGHLTIISSGTTDISTKRSTYTSSQLGAPDVSDGIIDGSRQYYRERGPDAFAGSHWCSISGPKRLPGPGIFLTDTVAALAGSNRHLQLVGTDTVRGIETTHYRITGGGSPVQIWVDARDHLRRLGWSPGGNAQSQSTDFFNFDTPVTITVPTNTRACSTYPNTP
jgi:hypothetical protein